MSINKTKSSSNFSNSFPRNSNNSADNSVSRFERETENNKPRMNIKLGNRFDSFEKNYEKVENRNENRNENRSEKDFDNSYENCDDNSSQNNGNYTQNHDNYDKNYNQNHQNTQIQSQNIQRNNFENRNSSSNNSNNPKGRQDLISNISQNSKRQNYEIVQNSSPNNSNSRQNQSRGGQQIVPRRNLSPGNPQTLRKDEKENHWFTKLISKPDLTVPVVVCLGFAIFFGYNFGVRTGGVNSETAINSFGISSSRSITPRRIFEEPESTNLKFEANTINHILITGQSLAAGETGYPALSLSQNYENLRITNGKFEPLIENTVKNKERGNVETIASGFASNLTFGTEGQKYQILISNNGLGGTPYARLKKGTELYQNNINDVIAAQKIAKQMGKKYQVPAVLVIHGETDNFLGNGDKYESFLQEWYRDYNTDIKAITGQTNDIFFFTDQMSSFGVDLATPKGIASPAVTLAQLKASEQNPRIIMVAPKYFLTYTDNLHLNNLSYRKLGEYYAKAYKQTILQQNPQQTDEQTEQSSTQNSKNQTLENSQKPWKPLMPTSSILGGKTIKIQFNIPKAPLVLDTENILQKENYGFEYTESSETSKVENPSAKIESVRVVGNSVEITLDKVPTGQNKKIEYGLKADYLPDNRQSGTGPVFKGSSGGNLRDSDANTSVYGNSLWNWAVHFEQNLD